MKIDIWSDVVCPFCYIGKRKFEAALNTFPHKENIEVVWHSYQLSPDMQYVEGKDVYTHLAEMKGQSRDWSVRMHEGVVQSAKAVGLDYRFDKAKVANTFDAHRVIQLAKKHGLSDAVEERFFRAYFTEGELISDHATLVRLAAEAGLDKEEVAGVLADNTYADEVQKDIEKAYRLGCKGVPFFVMDWKYGVAGAQDTDVFSQVIEKAFNEWREENNVPVLNIPEGQSCAPGEC